MDMETYDVKLSGNAADTVIKSSSSEWYIASFDMPHMPYMTHPSDTKLKENPSHGETLSYEWLEATKTDNMLRLKAAENTSDMPRVIRICIAGGENVTGGYLYVTQYPEGYTPGADEGQHSMMTNRDILEFSGDASSEFVKAFYSEWDIFAFLSESLDLLKQNPSILRHDKSGSETLLEVDKTLAYEWIEASKTGDNQLKVSVTENTSDAARYINIQLAGYLGIEDKILHVVQYPKEKK
jgi:hypothetical protein